MTSDRDAALSREIPPGGQTPTDALLDKGRQLVVLFKLWKADGCPIDERLGLMETLVNRISRDIRELLGEAEGSGGGGAPPSSGPNDQRIPFSLELIVETEPGSETTGGLLVRLPNGKTDWIPKSQLQFQILEAPIRVPLGKGKFRTEKKGRVEIHIPRWLARKRDMI